MKFALYLLGFTLVITVCPVSASNVFFSDTSNCVVEPRECIKLAEQRLETLQQYELEWFRVKQQHLSALYDLQELDQLLTELTPLIDLKDAPPVFMTSVYMMYGKLMYIGGNEQQGERYAQQAVDLIKAVNEVSLDPARYAEVINLYHYMKKFEQAKSFGAWAEKRMNSIKKPVLLANFDTARGHTFLIEKNYTKARFFYTRALASYKQINDWLEVANTYHNVAQTYALEGNVKNAEEYFLTSLKWHKKYGEKYNHTGMAFTQIRLSEAYLKSGQHDKASEIVADLERQKLADYQRPYLDALKEQLALPKK